MDPGASAGRQSLLGALNLGWWLDEVARQTHLGLRWNAYLGRLLQIIRVVCYGAGLPAYIPASRNCYILPWILVILSCYHLTLKLLFDFIKTRQGTDPGSIMSTEKRPSPTELEAPEMSDRSVEAPQWTEAEETAVRHKLDWQIVPTVTFLYLLCFLDRSVFR